MEFSGNETERRGLEETKSEEIVTREWEEHEEDVLQWIGSIFFTCIRKQGDHQGGFPEHSLQLEYAQETFPPLAFVMFDIGSKV